MGLTAPAEPDPVVIRDVFPALVSLDTGQLMGARVVVTRTRVYVWTGDGGAPTLALVARYDAEPSRIPPLNASRTVATHLQLVDDSGAPTMAVRITRQRGCGCGSPLRAWTPWQPFRKAAS